MDEAESKYQKIPKAIYDKGFLCPHCREEFDIKSKELFSDKETGKQLVRCLLCRKIYRLF